MSRGLVVWCQRNIQIGEIKRVQFAYYWFLSGTLQFDGASVPSEYQMGFFFSVNSMEYRHTWYRDQVSARKIVFDNAAVAMD